MFVGKYAYRFGGSAMQLGNEYHLVGVGVMSVDERCKITGYHTSTITLLQGIAPLEVSRFTLTGSLGPREDGFGQDDLEAKITFTSQKKDSNGKPVQILEGTFSAVPNSSTDGEGFWLISTGAFNETTNSVADEVVMGEARKIG